MMTKFVLAFSFSCLTAALLTHAGASHLPTAWQSGCGNTKCECDPEWQDLNGSSLGNLDFDPDELDVPNPSPPPDTMLWGGDVKFTILNVDSEVGCCFSTEPVACTGGAACEFGFRIQFMGTQPGTSGGDDLIGFEIDGDDYPIDANQKTSPIYRYPACAGGSEVVITGYDESGNTVSAAVNIVAFCNQCSALKVGDD